MTRRHTILLLGAIALVLLPGCKMRTRCATFEDSADRGASCQNVWQDCEDGMMRAIVCRSGEGCDCRVDGHTRRSFQSANLCLHSDVDDLTRLANEKCGWRIRVGSDDPFELP